MNARSLGCWIVFVALLAVNISSHCMWGDELQAWSLTRNSSDIFELFVQLKYEGHPVMWYLLLWIPAHFTANPEAMQLVTFLLGTATLYLVWFHSPFSATEKALLCLSYQVGYNLTVPSRSYGLGLLLVFLFSALHVKAKKHPWSRWLVLAVLANVHLYFAVGTVVLATVWFTQEDADSSLLNGLSIYLCGIFLSLFALGRVLADLLSESGHIAIVLLCVLGLGVYLHRLVHGIRSLPLKLSLCGLFLISLCGAAVSLLPHAKKNPVSLTNIAQSLSTLGGGLTPLIKPYLGNYWNQQLPFWLGITLFLSSATLIFLIFRKQPIQQALLGSTFVFFLVVFCVRHNGTSWHVGVYFTILVALVWMKRLKQTEETMGSRFFLILLGLQAFYGIQAHIGSKLVPLSNSKACAAWVREHRTDVEAVFGRKIFPTLGVATYLEEPLYFPEADQKRSHTTWDDWAKTSIIPVLVLRQMKRDQLGTVYLIAPLEDKDSLQREFETHKNGMSCEVRSVVKGALIENYVILRIVRKLNL